MLFDWGHWEDVYNIVFNLQLNHVYKVVLTQEIKIHVRRDLYYGHIKI